MSYLILQSTDVLTQLLDVWLDKVSITGNKLEDIL